MEAVGIAADGAGCGCVRGGLEDRGREAWQGGIGVVVVALEAPAEVVDVLLHAGIPSDVWSPVHGQLGNEAGEGFVEVMEGERVGFVVGEAIEEIGVAGVDVDGVEVPLAAGSISDDGAVAGAKNDLDWLAVGEARG